MTRLVACLAAVAGGATLPAQAHHSFAMYDQTQTLVLTGVVYQFVAQANHAELHVYLIGADGKLEKGTDGKPHAYGVEMAGAAAVAEQGITADSLPPGSISAIAKCPWKTPPVPGKTCDTVDGHELLGAPKF
jgi:hypothetical protein